MVELYVSAGYYYVKIGMWSKGYWKEERECQMTCSYMCGVLQDCSTVVNKKVANGVCENQHRRESQTVRETDRKLLLEKRRMKIDGHADVSINSARGQ